MKKTWNSIQDIWGERTPYHNQQRPERFDVRFSEEPDYGVQLACVLCSNNNSKSRIASGSSRPVSVGNRGRTVLDCTFALRDEELIAAGEKLSKETKRQLSWLMTRIKSGAPQTLIASE